MTENSYLILNLRYEKFKKKISILEKIKKKFTKFRKDTMKNLEENNNINHRDNKNNNIKKTIKKRNPGIDLIRIIAMYGILINHSIYKKYAKKKFSKFKRLEILHILLFWHNNGYALISGVIGVRTIKYSNLLYLWLCVFFYTIGIGFYFQKFKHVNINIKNKYKEYFPMIYEKYWYFTAYFGMFLYLPAINKGIIYLNKSQFKLMVLSSLGILVFWREYMNPERDVFKTHKGYSTLWLLTFYITGAYIGKYRIEYSGKKKFIFCIICLFIYFSLSIFYYKINFEPFDINGYYKRKIILKLKSLLTDYYDSILKITLSISISLFFLQIKYNKYLAKIICFIGPRTFAIYLIHANSYINHDIISNLFKDAPTDLSLISVYKLVMVTCLTIFVICIIIDYLRDLLFKILRIRKICILLEKLAFKLLG